MSELPNAALFSLEALFARHGDALILHFGPSEDPAWILIDGGPAGVYDGYLQPRILELRSRWGYSSPESFPLAMILVSHADDDHINGVLRLMEAQLVAETHRRPLPYAIQLLWHNSFGDVIEIQDAQASNLAHALETAKTVQPETAAVVASVPQGRTLRNAAERLGMKKVNHPFKDLVMRTDSGSDMVEMANGLTLTIIGPGKQQVDNYRKRWNKDMETILKKEGGLAEVASFEDNSPFNLASIVALAQIGEHRMLLTGDARGDFILEGLTSAGFLKTADDAFHVDLLKIPHHGSANNVTDCFFRRVTADHYLISGDGNHGNPDVKTLEMIASARGDDDYTIYLTIQRSAVDTEHDPERKSALSNVVRWVDSGKPENCKVVFREPDPARSVIVNLADPIEY